MAFNLPTAAYLMTTNASTNRGTDGSPVLGLKTAGNLPITTNGAQIQNNTGSSQTGAPDRLYFGLTSQSSTGGRDISSDTQVLICSIQYNAPNRIQSSTMANEGASATVVSGTTETNFRRWFIGGNDTPFCQSQGGPVTICIDPKAGNRDATGGTFDETDWSGWGFGCVRFNLQGTSTLLAFFQRVFIFSTTKSSSNIPNFTGASSDWDDAFTAVQGSDYTDKIGNWLTKSGTSFFVPCPFQFGDGSTATTFDDGGVTVVSPGDNVSGQENFRLSNEAMRVYLNQRNNAADSVTLSGSYNWGTAAPWNFDEDNAATCTITGAIFSGMGEFRCGGSVVGAATFTLASGEVVVINGADLDGSTINGDVNVEGSTPSTFTNLTVTGAMDFDTAGTYTLDGCTIDEVTNSSGGAVTLNLTNGASVTTNTGPSITINNNVDVTLSNLIAGSRVYIRNTTDSTDLFNEIEATTEFSDTVNYTANKSLLIRVRNASGVTKYKPFETTGTLTANGFSLSVNQIEDS